MKSTILVRTRKPKKDRRDRKIAIQGMLDARGYPFRVVNVMTRLPKKVQKIIRLGACIRCGSEMFSDFSRMRKAVKFTALTGNNELVGGSIHLGCLPLYDE